MKIAIVGPTHPYKGGIAQHTTALAHHLTAAGHQVEIVSWRNQYPFFYPGEQFVPNGKPELSVFANTKRVLSWKNPFGWIIWGRKLKHFDEVIFVWWVPIVQGPVYLNMLRALGRRGPRKIMVCHNLVSHNSSPADILLTRQVFNQVDRIVVHTDALAEDARHLSHAPISVAAMPAHLPGHPSVQPSSDQLKHSLLFFGLVRHYKGVDILLRALALLPDIQLTVAGEMWGKQEASLRQLIVELKLQSRVKLLPGYVPADDIAPLFASCDALVMPYRSGTASQTSELAFAYGRPVIATTVGSMPEQIHDAVDGILCVPDDIEALAAAIRHFYQPGVAHMLRANLPTSTTEHDWQKYVEIITNNK